MKKGHELKIRERLSKSYLQVIFIASISAIVGIIALLVMTRMYNNALNNYGFSQGDIGKAMTAFSGARSEVRAAVGYMDEDIISDAKDTYYTRKDSFQQYLDDIESSMVTQAGKDAYNQIVKDLDGYWDLSDQLIEEGSTTDQEISKKVQRREADELGPAYQVVYNDLKNLMNIYVQKGGSDRISFCSDGDYCCDHYDRSDHSFHFEWQKIWKPDRRWNFKAITADFRTSENICGRRS